MGDHLSAKAKLWSWAGVLVDSVVFFISWGYKEDRFTFSVPQ